MSANVRVLVVGLVVGTVFPARVDCGDQSPPPVNGCAGAADNDFEDELWAKVGIPKCLTCHRQGGDADESKFVLADPRKSNTSARNGAMRHNRDAFARMARVKEKGQSRLLLKVAGELDHGGGDVVKPDSSAYRMLAEFVRRESAERHSQAACSRAGPQRFAVLRGRPPAAPPSQSRAGRTAPD